MRRLDFAKYISDFITKYLPNELGVSRNTIASYRDTIVLLLRFYKEVKEINVEKLSMSDINKDGILDFLDWLEKVRKSSVSTRNSRLAGLHSFYRYLQRENLDYLHECQKILGIRFKKSIKPQVSYLSIEGIKLILQQPDISNEKGRRDLALLSILYDTGARVQEIIDLTPSEIRFEKPALIKVTGKGNKSRSIPMLADQLNILKNYIKESQLDKDYANKYPLFFNSRKEKLTRAGINHIVRKYVLMARNEDKSFIPEIVSCHCFRHSKAMHLLQAGVNLVYIRDILGHVSVKTTEVYARADSKHKREALEKAYIDILPNEEPKWAKNEDLISWLKKF